MLKAYAAVSTGVIVFALLAALGRAESQKARFAEIDAERISVVEADGRLALVLANTERLPGPTLAGKEPARELSAGRVDSAGMIFIDALYVDQSNAARLEFLDEAGKVIFALPGRAR